MHCPDEIAVPKWVVVRKGLWKTTKTIIKAFDLGKKTQISRVLGGSANHSANQARLKWGFKACEHSNKPNVICTCTVPHFETRNSLGLWTFNKCIFLLFLSYKNTNKNGLGAESAHPIRIKSAGGVKFVIWIPSLIKECKEDHASTSWVSGIAWT